MTRPRARALALALGVAALAAAAGASALDAGDRAPALDARDLAGAPVRSDDLLGKVVLVDFWATWCAPCREELPFLERLHRDLAAEGLVVVAISVDDDAADVRRYVQREGLTLRVVHDEGQRIAARWKPPRMPTSYVVDRAGVVRHVNPTFRAEHADRIEAQVRALLAASR